MSRHLINAAVNGDNIEFLCSSTQTLLDVLRDELNLKGTKNGCGTGDCGACTVIVDHRPVNSCLILGAELDGASIKTIEGMASGGKLHPLPQKFLEHAALQCGICTPGMLNMAKALLDKNPNPLKPVFKDSIIVFISCLFGMFVMDQVNLKPDKTPLSSNVFVDNPDF